MIRGKIDLSRLLLDTGSWESKNLPGPVTCNTNLIYQELFDLPEINLYTYLISSSGTAIKEKINPVKGCIFSPQRIMKVFYFSVYL